MFGVNIILNVKEKDPQKLGLQNCKPLVNNHLSLDGWMCFVFFFFFQTKLSCCYSWYMELILGLFLNDLLIIKQLQII